MFTVANIERFYGVYLGDDSVFLNTDYEVIVVTNNEVKDSSVTIENQRVDSANTNYYEDGNEDGDRISKFSQIPTKRYPKRTKGATCRELLQQIKPLTYLVGDEEPLENFHKQLNIILIELNRSTTTDFGIVINKPEKNENKRSSHSYEKLPVPKRKKSSLTGRVGVVNEARKRAQVINVKIEI